nr:redoxin domain-containing protein [Chloroflexota bacterium]
SGLAVLGVSQDSANITRSFARRQGATFPILIEPEGYPVSRAFDITATPTAFVIQRDGTIVYTTMGFFRDPINELGYTVARALGSPPFELFDDAGTGVPVFVPG